MTDTDLNVDMQDESPVDVDVSQADTDDSMQKPVFNKIQVQDVVRRERQKAYEKGKNEAMQELQAQSQQQAPQQAQAQSLGGMQQLSQADIEQLIAEKAPQLLQQQREQDNLQQTVGSFVAKMQAAEERHPGLEDRLNELDYSTPGITHLIKMANDMENTGDIMQELTSNPMKLGTLVTLMSTQPKLAQKAMNELSNSIKQNQDAIAQNQSTRDPISQIKPSSAGMDKGDMSVSDFRKMFKA